MSRHPYQEYLCKSALKQREKGVLGGFFRLKADFIGSVSAFIAKNGMRRAADGEKFLLQPTS